MIQRYLEVTYRKGKPLAAYLYFQRQPGDSSSRTEKRADGLVIDYAVDGRPIGIEITAPSKVTLSGLNETLASVGLAALPPDDLAPLLAGRAGLPA